MKKPEQCNSCTRWSNFFQDCSYFSNSLDDINICPCKYCLVKPMCQKDILCPLFKERVDDYFGLQKGLKSPEIK